jgi:hypothetical protein
MRRSFLKPEQPSPDQMCERFWTLPRRRLLELIRQDPEGEWQERWGRSCPPAV